MADPGEGEQIGRTSSTQVGDLVIGISDLLAQLLMESGDSTHPH